MAVMENPFQILTFIVAPAILTNSSSILSLGTSNRLARVVDRSRSLYDKLKESDKLTQDEKDYYKPLLKLISQRSLIQVKALTAFYIAVGAFAGTTLTSLLGATSTLFHLGLASKIIIGVALLFGLVGVGGLIVGTALLVREMWLAQASQRIEIQLTQKFINEHQF